ncbi:MAG: large subunit ribosomal protein L18 [Candidatus Paceibacteria bacterium]|jgi:large subunit ribosomal protein L18
MDKLALRKRRQGRIRSQVSGNEKRPRLAIFKSNKDLYAQLINDVKGETITSIDTRSSKAKTLVEKSKEIGATFSKSIADKNVKEIVFDRGGFRYTGAIKVFADTIRESGLKF